MPARLGKRHTVLSQLTIQRDSISRHCLSSISFDGYCRSSAFPRPALFHTHTPQLWFHPAAQSILTPLAACSECSRPLATSVWHKHLSLPLDPNYTEHRTSVFYPMTLGKSQGVASISEGKVRGGHDGGRFEGGHHGRLLASPDSFRHRLRYQITDSTSFSRWYRKQVTLPL